MRDLFLIKVVDDDLWCWSSSHGRFADDFSVAAIFQTRENAEKAIRAINRSLSDRPNQPTLTVYRNGTYEYVDTRETPMLLEVVEFEMVPKGC